MNEDGENSWGRNNIYTAYAVVFCLLVRTPGEGNAYLSTAYAVVFCLLARTPGEGKAYLRLMQLFFLACHDSWRIVVSGVAAED